MEERFKPLWSALHSTLTTSQIDKALRMTGLNWKDWREFQEQLNAEMEVKK